MSPSSVAHSQIPYHVRRAVERECESVWECWWPPDLLDAIFEGRKKYRSLDKRIRRPVTASQLAIIAPLLDRYWPERR